MKKFLIVLVLNAIASSLNAQDTDYRPFIEEGKVWVSISNGDFSYEGLPPEKPEDYYAAYYIEYNYFDGDTTIAGRSCTRWIQEYVRPTDGKSISYVVPIYEEDKKVWFFFEEKKGPYLLYDFGAEEGDTLVVESPYMLLYQRSKNPDYDKRGVDWLIDAWRDTLVVYSIGLETHGDREQLSMHFYSALANESKHESFLRNNYHMQGVGSHWAPMYNNCFTGQTITPWLLYCVVGDEILFESKSVSEMYRISPPTSVTSPSDKSVNSNFLDLSGRRLPSLPTRKGIYIKDGRKVLIK